MKIPKRKIRAGRVSIAVIVPWYSELNKQEADAFCMLANEYIPENISAMCVDGIMGFEKSFHGRAVAALRDFGNSIDMDAVKSTLALLVEENIAYIDEATGHIRIRQELLEGEWEEIEVDGDCFLKEPKNPGKKETKH